MRSPAWSATCRSLWYTAAHAAQDIGDCPFGDDQTEQLVGKPGQAFKAYMVAVMQICEQRADPGAEQRARRHLGRRLGAIFAAAATEQLDACDDRPDRRQIDVIIAMTAALDLTRNIAVAMPAGRRHDPLGLIRCLGQRPVPANSRGALAVLRLAALTATLAEIVLRERDA